MHIKAVPGKGRDNGEIQIVCIYPSNYGVCLRSSSFIDPPNKLLTDWSARHRTIPITDQLVSLSEDPNPFGQKRRAARSRSDPEPHPLVRVISGTRDIRAADTSQHILESRAQSRGLLPITPDGNTVSSVLHWLMRGHFIRRFCSLVQSPRGSVSTSSGCPFITPLCSSRLLLSSAEIRLFFFAPDVSTYPHIHAHAYLSCMSS